MPAENKGKINTDLSTWEAQFKAAIKSGNKTEKDLFKEWKINLIKKNGNCKIV